MRTELTDRQAQVWAGVPWGEAACAGADPDIMVPNLGRGEKRAPAVALARQYCLKCPIIFACDYAATVTGAEGVWGGTLRGWKDTARVEADRRAEAETAEPAPDCPRCGGTGMQRRGWRAAGGQRFPRWHCQECKAWSGGNSERWT